MKKSLFIILTAITFSVHGQNKLESSIDLNYTGTSWNRVSGADYEYDSNKNLTKEINYTWDGAEWKNSSKSEYTYNSNNKVTEEIRSSWSAGQYENVQKTGYTYNTSDLLSEVLTKEWNVNSWEDSDKSDLSYNANNQLVLLTESEYDGTNWVSENRAILTYLANNLVEISSEVLNGAVWESTSRVIMTYNSNDQTIATLFEYYDGTNWTESKKRLYELDADLNRVKDSIYDEGILSSKVEYAYDLTAALSDFAHPFKSKEGLEYALEDFPYVNKVLNTTSFTYNTNISAFDTVHKRIYNYTNHIVLSTENMGSIQNISLYPNPSSDFIQISGITKSETIAVYDMLGTKAFDLVVNENDKVNIHKLTNGIYVMKFENGTALKFMKK